ncbi:MAG TPA: putative DNA modification/repair radical SAM protein [Polyangiaceae bacterium]
MELRRKLEILADAAKYDASCASGGSNRAATAGGIGSTEGMGICHSYTPDGRCVSLLKILFTNVCIYDCRYCTSRISSDVERARFTVDEVVRLTLDFYRRNYIEGLFLSSGVLKSPDYTMEQLVAVARSLRLDHSFGGYIHLKSAPGVSDELLAAAGLYADRLSVNVELPTKADLATLAHEKTMEAVEASMGSIADEKIAAKEEKKRFAPAGQSTQMIVGASPATDQDILVTSKHLYDEYALRRVYYSAFSPISHADPRLPAKSPPLVREHRLYQADWLVRFYGFDVGEIVTPDKPQLDLEIDPKLAWALSHREYFPVDVNRAPKEALLRVPGLGVKTVIAILQARRHRKLRREDLAKLHVLKRAHAFLLAEGDVHTPAKELDRLELRAKLTPAKQLGLFEAQTSAVRGEL